MTKRARTRIKTTFQEQMCQIFHDWLASRDGEPGTLDECFDYAKVHGAYQAPRYSERRQFKMEMSRSISRERTIDDEGTPIRSNHVFKVKDEQGYLFYWGELLKLRPDHAKMSMKQRLLGLANRAIQLDRDKTHYNKHNSFGAQLELDYDLNPHVEHAKHPTEYPDERPDGEDDGEAQPV